MDYLRVIIIKYNLYIPGIDKYFRLQTYANHLGIREFVDIFHGQDILSHKSVFVRKIMVDLVIIVLQLIHLTVVIKLNWKPEASWLRYKLPLILPTIVFI